jgi:murein DD-endopeptidase MepM/ murein hydrolase activator NlpD
MIPEPVSGQLLESQYLDDNITKLKDKSQLLTSSDKKKYNFEEVEKAARQFEQMFVFYILKTMRGTIEKSGLIDGGRSEEIYTSMLDNEYASEISQSGSLGLSRLIVDDLSRRGLLKEYEKNAQSHSLLFPVKGEISSPFGMREDPIDKEERFHYGMDIAAPCKSEIVAAESGRIVYSGSKGNFGNMVVIDHENGYKTLYAHNSKNLVEEGEKVKKGEPIALVGDSGRSTGPHLHFEVRRNGQSINPASYL